MTDIRIDIIKLVDDLLNSAVDQRASDLHIEPTADGVEARLRVDGFLRTSATLDTKTGASVVSRLMVLAGLLTYRLDVPQEGRIAMRSTSLNQCLDLRLAIIPTVLGLRAAIRLPAELTQPQRLDELGLPACVLEQLRRFARTDAGMLIVTGPAGAGKTTTIYALLQYIVSSQHGLSIVTLEDPVERQLSGITQIEVKPFGELTYERALRSILRQDPQVLMLGEIRDDDTARLAISAALSGHRLICTLHASTPGGAIARLIEMGIEPHRITSSVWGVLTQRLLRKREGTEGNAYRGRIPVAELLTLDREIRDAVLARSDASTITAIAARQPEYLTLRAAADELVRLGLTDAAEVARVLGENLE